MKVVAGRSGTADRESCAFSQDVRAIRITGNDRNATIVNTIRQGLDHVLRGFGGLGVLLDRERMARS